MTKESEMTSTSTQPRTEEVLAAIDGIGELSAAKAAEGEANRRVSDEVMEALRGAGALTTFIPSRFGGSDRNVADFLRISRQVALYDGGTGFCSELTALRPDTGTRDGTRNPDARPGTRLLANRTFVVKTGTDYSLWRYIDPLRAFVILQRCLRLMRRLSVVPVTLVANGDILAVTSGAACCSRCSPRCRRAIASCPGSTTA